MTNTYHVGFESLDFPENQLILAYALLLLENVVINDELLI